MIVMRMLLFSTQKPVDCAHAAHQFDLAANLNLARAAFGVMQWIRELEIGDGRYLSG